MNEDTRTTTETVKKAGGSVKIALEEYNDLLARAAVKPPVIYNTVTKTPEMQAMDNKAVGALLISGSVALGLIGGIMYAAGARQAKKLRK